MPVPSIARKGGQGCSVTAGSPQSAMNITARQHRFYLVNLRARRWCRICGPAEIGDPEQGAAHHIAAVDLAAFQLDLLDPEEGLHRVRQAGAAEQRGTAKPVPAVWPSAPHCRNCRRYQASMSWHHAMKAVAPQYSDMRPASPRSPAEDRHAILRHVRGESAAHRTPA